MDQHQSKADMNVDKIFLQLEPLLKRSDADPRPVALMLCGCPGSGKSTLAKVVARMVPSFERFSIDGIIASRHGIYAVDYPETQYEACQKEADGIFQHSVEETLADGKVDVVLDRAFYAKEDRDFYKALIEQHGGRWVLVYLKVPKDVLWRRIAARRKAGVNADSALEINKELLDVFYDGFEVPSGEGEMIHES